MPLRVQAAAFLAGCGIHINNSMLALFGSKQAHPKWGLVMFRTPLESNSRPKKLMQGHLPCALHVHERAPCERFTHTSLLFTFLVPVLIGQTPGDPALLGMSRNEPPAPPLVGLTSRDPALLGMFRNGPPASPILAMACARYDFEAFCTSGGPPSTLPERPRTSFKDLDVLDKWLPSH